MRSLEVTNPECGKITDCGALGQITEHGYKSFGMKPMNKYEEKRIKTKYQYLPRLRAERFICMERWAQGVEELKG